MSGNSLTSVQAAQYLGITKRMFMRAAQRGDIVPLARSADGILRYFTSDVEAYGQRIGPRRRRAWRPRYNYTTLERSQPGLEEHLHTIYSAMSCGVLVYDAVGDCVYANEVAQRLLCVSVDQSRQISVKRAERALLRDDGSLFPSQEVPTTLALQTGQPQRSITVGLVLPTGEHRWLQVDAVPMLDADGNVHQVVTSLIDISERKQAEALAAAGAALATSLEPAQIYQIILDQAVKVLPCANACVFLLEDNWAVVAASWGVPNMEVGSRAFQMNDWEWQFWPRAGDPPLYLADTHTVEDWSPIPPWLGEHEVRSTVAVPLAIEGELLGCLDLASTSPHFYTERHIQVAAAFGEQITQALRNARLYTAEQARARAAEALAQLRHDFVAAVSHELRTPLTAIIGYTELLQERWPRLADAKRLEQLDRIRVSAHRQKRLVEDLLLVSKLESDLFTPQCASVSLARLAHHAADEVKRSYLEQPIDLEGPPDLRVCADSERTIQLLTNLLDNAAKYSPEGRPIKVHWNLEDQYAILRVRDYGPGVPELGRELLFTRFGRVPGSRIRAGRVGTGLGLYLSRRLAEGMGGTLDLECTGSQGSTFRLCLPLASD